MLCDRVIELSFEYMRGAMEAKAKYRFEAHIKKCSKCHNRFEFFKANAVPQKDEVDAPNELKDLIMKRIDGEKYKRKSHSALKLRWSVVSLVVIMLISAAVYAQPIILKSFEELVNVVTVQPSPQSVKSRDEIKEAKKILERHKKDIDQFFSTMKTGELKTYSFENEPEDFYIHLCKGNSIQLITYGFREGIRGYLGGIPFDDKFDYEKIKSITSLKEATELGYFIPNVEKLPDGYKLDKIYYRESERKIEGMIYSNDKQETISLLLSEEKLEADKKAVKSIERINGYQSLYMEGNLFFNQKPFAAVSLYLGEGKRQKVLTLAVKIPGSINKEQLLEMANNIQFYNESANIRNGNTIDDRVDHYRDFISYVLLENREYIDLKGPEMDDVVDEYKKMVKEGKRDFSINMKDGMRLKRELGYDKKPVYILLYEGRDFNVIKPYISYPALINKDILSKVSLEKGSIEGKEGEKVINQYFSFKLRESKRYYCFTSDVHLLPEKLIKYSALDILLDNEIITYSGDDGVFEKIIFDRYKNPYSVRDYSYRKTYNTVMKINGAYLSYSVSADDYLLNGMSDEEFVNRLELIQQ